MEKITFEAFNELVSKDEELKARIDAVPDDENKFAKLSEIVESLGYELIPDAGDEIEALTDDEMDEVAGGARCEHDYKLQWKETTESGIKRLHFRCRKCGITMRRSTRVKQ